MSSDPAASIKARLLNRAKEQKEEFERTLTRYAAERLLFRLGASEARERCVLKGASLLAFWMDDPYRATRDVDLLASGPSDDGAVRSLMAEICAVPCPEDALHFDLSELDVQTILVENDSPGKRARFQAFLGKARIPVQVDLGVGDALGVEPVEIEYPTMLKTLPAARLRAYRRESSVAEKFEAMVSLDTRNSRMKDFHDIWALAGAFEFEGPVLQRAVAACFERRGTPWTAEAPRPLTAAFYRLPELESRWRSYLAAGAVLVPPPKRFEEVGERIIRFLSPIRDSIVGNDSFATKWPAGGPWSRTRGAEGDPT